MRSLTEIEVRLNELDDPQHVEIIVGAATELGSENLSEFEFPTEEELCAAFLYLAGILGRLAVAAAPWMAKQQQDHGCRLSVIQYSNLPAPILDDGCALHGSPTMIDPGSDLGYAPNVWFTVAADQADTWLERIRGWLAEIATAGL